MKEQQPCQREIAKQRSRRRTSRRRPLPRRQSKGQGAHRRSRICGLRREFAEPIEEPLNATSASEAEFELRQSWMKRSKSSQSLTGTLDIRRLRPDDCLPNALEQSAASIELRWDCHRSPHESADGPASGDAGPPADGVSVVSRDLVHGYDLARRASLLFGSSGVKGPWRRD